MQFDVLPPDWSAEAAMLRGVVDVTAEALTTVLRGASWTFLTRRGCQGNIPSGSDCGCTVHRCKRIVRTSVTSGFHGDVVSGRLCDQLVRGLQLPRGLQLLRGLHLRRRLQDNVCKYLARWHMDLCG